MIEKDVMFMSDTVWVAFWIINWKDLAPSFGLVGVAGTRQEAS